ncbi:hypothetical protein HH_1710 [Helicobacter hepaticus ATCC 51449]|uniref:Uncharacterized protein n=1 Tax=Helicobacter hepaticus (strain ATCC 51449 / 3B1) TaxID=235279 RepID=Q7VFG6_HELHP|nr:hypothetical protein HH_1710 [Helicobacter hepaticus ATCC 51449]
MWVKFCVKCAFLDISFLFQKFAKLCHNITY